MCIARKVAYLKKKKKRHLRRKLACLEKEVYAEHLHTGKGVKMYMFTKRRRRRTFLHGGGGGGGGGGRLRRKFTCLQKGVYPTCICILRKRRLRRKFACLQNGVYPTCICILRNRRLRQSSHACKTASTPNNFGY